MKKILLLIVSITLILTAVFATGCDGKKEEFNNEFNIDHDDLGLKPDSNAQTGITILDPSMVKATSTELSSDAAVKETACYIFNLANDNLAKVAYYANYAQGSGTATITNMKMSGSMQVREVRIKDGAAMYMVTMGRVVDGFNTETGKSESFITGLCRNLLDYGNRKYTPDGQTFYLQSGKSKALVENSLDNFYTENPFIDWNKAGKIEKIGVNDFMKKEYYRSHYAETNSSVIIPDNITDAKVVYSEDKGLYEIEITVDVTTDALKLATESTRNSANSSDISFRYQTIKCEIWDCGLFRMYHTSDSWAGSLLDLISGYSENTWTKYFTYNKQNAPAYQIPAESELSWAK